MVMREARRDGARVLRPLQIGREHRRERHAVALRLLRDAAQPFLVRGERFLHVQQVLHLELDLRAHGAVERVAGVRVRGIHRGRVDGPAEAGVVAARRRVLPTA